MILKYLGRSEGWVLVAELHLTLLPYKNPYRLLLIPQSAGIAECNLVSCQACDLGQYLVSHFAVFILLN